MGGGNKDRARERAREWYKNNRARALATAKICTARWRKANKERYYRHQLAYQLRRKYGMTIEQYDAMLLSQGGLCAICKGLPENGRRRLDVDHDHETGVVRGLLCVTCNVALHKLERSRVWAKSAEDYLQEKSRCPN